MPGLVRGVARTAVVAGTATAVSNRVSRRQAGRWAAQEEQAYAQQQQAYVPAQPQYAAPPPAPEIDVEKLKELGKLRDQGILTEQEFQEQKERLLNG